MSTTINASTAGSGGLVQSSDASGILELQSGGVTKFTLNSSGVFIPGHAIQVQSTKLGTVATGTTLMINDNTIPQNTEGDQFISLAFTPLSAASKLRFEALMFVAHTVATANVVAAIFRDSVADAIAAGNVSCPNANTGYMVAVNYDMTSPGTSAYTYKLRAGGNAAGTLTVNGWGSTQYFGGVLFSSLTITEYAQ